jgi:hypothetical protein
MRAWLVHEIGGGLLGEVEADDHNGATAQASKRWRSKKLHVGLKSAMEAERRRYERRFARFKDRTAYHEAGHAVFAENFGPGVVEVVIGVEVCSSGGKFDPDINSMGRTVFAKWSGKSPYCTYTDHDAGEAAILTAMAGPMAERRYAGLRKSWRRLVVGSDADVIDTHVPLHAKAHDTATYAAYRKYMECRAAAWLDALWPGVKAVAAALLSHGRLDAAGVRLAIASAVSVSTVEDEA